MKESVLSLLCAMSIPAVVQAAEPMLIPVEVEVCRETAVLLPGNPGAGYSWQLAETLPKKSPVEVQVECGSKTEQGGAGGAPAPAKVCFRGLRAGQAVVRLVYTRTWEKTELPTNEVLFEVRVVK